MLISFLSNLSALNAKGHLEKNGSTLEKAMERVASGRRINRAGDDAAGLAISNTLEAKYRSLQVAHRNTMDTLSMTQVVEGGMNEASNLLIRMRELAVQGASDTISDKERELLNAEVGQIKEELDRLASSTRYFGTELLNGTGKTFQFQIGTENSDHDRITYEASQIDVQSGSLGVSGVDLGDAGSSLSALESIDEAMHKVNVPRANIGALQFRMQSIANNLATYSENVSGARSRIVDADLAAETTNIVKGQIQQRAGLSVLSQANQLPSLALKLTE